MRVYEIPNTLVWKLADEQVETMIDAGEPYDVYVQGFYMSKSDTDPGCRVFAKPDVAAQLAADFKWRIHAVLPRTRTYVLVADRDTATITAQLKPVQAA